MRDVAAGSVIVIGSFVVGITVRLARLPLPGETLPADAFDLGPGGKGTNLAVGVARLGGAVELVAKTGDDEFGQMAQRLYEGEGISTGHLHRSAEEQTGVGLVYIDAGTGENTIGLHLGANLSLTAEEVTEFMEYCEPAPIVTAQLEVRDEVVEAAFAVASKRGIRTVLNPAPARSLPRSILAKTDVITPNRNELFQLLGVEVPPQASDGEIVRAAKELSALGPGAVVVTLGSRGALVLEDDIPPVWIDPPQVEPVDTVGAGDAFNAGLAWALSRGQNLSDAARIATVCGGLATRRLGVVDALPTLAEIENFVA